MSNQYTNNTNQEDKKSNTNQEDRRKPTYSKKKVDPIKFNNLSITYKRPDILRRFITSDKGKIQSRKFTNVSSKNQRLLATEIKRARYLGLLPNS